MKDSLGVNRGHCKDCGEDKCKDYKVQKNTDLCGYCGCYPVKHVKIRSEEKLLTKTQTAEEQADQSRLNADAEVEEVVKFCFEMLILFIIQPFYEKKMLKTVKMLRSSYKIFYKY